MANEQYELYQQGTAAELASLITGKLNGVQTAIAPLLTAGAAQALTGSTPTEQSYLYRPSAAPTDGVATIKAIRGNTLRWNQMVSDSATSVTVPSGHKYAARIDGTATLATSDGTAITVTGGTDNIFDLTTMFGAGNEPSTVAEFEALFPEPYYEYDAGSLLSVNMEGIETVGFNQWDEEWVLGTISTTTGADSPSSERIRSKNYIPVFPDTDYYIKVGDASSVLYIYYYDADKKLISDPSLSNTTFDYKCNNVSHSPANARYIRFNPNGDYGTIYKGDICINLSWSGRRNGEYESYWSAQRAIDLATYFPTGLKKAGTVYDELTATEAITRVGVVDLGTLTWNYDVSGCFAAAVSGKAVGFNNFVCSKYETASTASVANLQDKHIVGGTGSSAVYVKDTAYGTDVNAFETAMSGVYLFYALATPTVTTYDPLNMTYRVAADGTERVIVPTGEMSAPPVMEVAYGPDAEGLRDMVLATIAPVENGLASANYAVGSYLIHGGTICKVTTAIASGEAIAIGTNVTATTVMTEVLSLIQ